MTNYRRKPTAAQAWQYDRQPQAQWPEWVRNHRVNTNMGQQPIGLGAGVVLVPTKGGTTLNMVVGDYLVLEGATTTDPVNGTTLGGVLSVLKPEAFDASFEADVAPEAPASAAEPAKAPKAARAKPADESEATPEPVVEAAPTEEA